MILFGCTKYSHHVVEPITDEDTYYEAFNEKAQEEVLSVLNEDIVDVPKQMLKVGTELPDIDMVTYDGDVINFSDYKGKNVVLQLTAYWCLSCKEETTQYLDNIVSNNEDIVFVQAFVEGAKEDEIEDGDGNKIITDTIKQFYDEADVEMNDNVTIVQESKTLEEYAYDTIGLSYYPSFLFFDKDGKLAYFKDQVITANEFDKIVDTVLQDDSLKLYENLADGLSSASDFIRDWEDVKADFSEDQQALLNELNLDSTYGEMAFYGNIGKHVAVDTKLVDINGKDVELTGNDGFTIYTFLSEDDKNIESEVKELNKFAKTVDDSVTMLTFLIPITSDDAVTVYENLSVKPDGYVFDARYNSPEALYDLTLYASPQTIFVNEKDDICAGAYLGTYSLEALQNVYNLIVSGKVYTTVAN